MVYIIAECRSEMFSLWLGTTSKHRVVEKDALRTRAIAGITTCI